MTSKLKIISWNACLGALNKMNYIRNFVNEHKPDILFLQETEIPKNMDNNLLRIDGYELILSENEPKSRSMCYYRTEMNVKITTDKFHEIILISYKKFDIYGIYMPYKLNQSLNHMDYLDGMINFIKRTKNKHKKMLICGDLNLDFKFVNEIQYHQSKLYKKWSGFTESEILKQHVKATTWRRIIQNAVKESILDHVYAPLDVCIEITTTHTSMSDHKLLKFQVLTETETKRNRDIKIMRKWGSYSSEKMLQQMSQYNWDNTINMSVQDHCDVIDVRLTETLQNIAPEIQLRSKESSFNWSLSLIKIKRQRQNAWKKYKRTKNIEVLERVRELDRQFKQEIQAQTKQSIRKTIKTGDPKTFWNAVNHCLGKKSFNTIPDIEYNGELKKTNADKAQAFSEFFKNKVETIVQTTNTNQDEPEDIIAYDDKLFVTEENILKAIKKKNQKKVLGLTEYQWSV